MAKLICVFSFVCIYAIVLTSQVLTTDASSDSDNDGSSVDGKYKAAELVQLGKKINSPLLKMIGLTLCNFHPCSKWSQWSECSAQKGHTFGTRNRTRDCQHTSDGCYSNGTKRDTEISLCEVCPPGFNKTGRFCLMQIIEESVSYFDAVKRCLKEGGHLLSADSREKLKELGDTFTIRSTFWVDGNFDSSSGQWVFQYGGVPDDFNWAYGQPDGQNCMALATDFTRYDVQCTDGYYISCEF